MRFKAKNPQQKIVVGPATEPATIQRSYQQVACDFTDELEHFSVLRMDIEVLYWNADAQLEKVRGQIIDVYSLNKEEYIKMDSNTEIRLDKIFEIRTV